MQAMPPEPIKRIIEFEKSSAGIRADYDKAMIYLDRKLANRQLTSEQWGRVADYQFQLMHSRVTLLAELYKSPYDNAA